MEVQSQPVSPANTLPRLKKPCACLKKVDAMPWRWGVSASAYGVRLGLRASDARSRERLLARLPLGWKEASGPEVEVIFSFVRGGEGRFHKAYSGKALFSRAFETEPVLDALEAEMQLYVAAMSRTRVFVHAGVVEWEGELIVIPGRSHSGKTSLVAALLRQGARYYSDEYAVIDAHGRVYPYAKPLGLREGEVQRKVAPAAFGAAAGAAPREAGLVVLTEYREGARFSPKTLSPGQGALELLQHTVSARVAPARAMAALGKVAARAAFVKSPRGEASALAPRLLEELQTRRRLRGAFDAE